MSKQLVLRSRTYTYRTESRWSTDRLQNHAAVKSRNREINRTPAIGRQNAAGRSRKQRIRGRSRGRSAGATSGARSGWSGWVVASLAGETSRFLAPPSHFHEASASHPVEAAASRTLYCITLLLWSSICQLKAFDERAEARARRDRLFWLGSWGTVCRHGHTDKKTCVLPTGRTVSGWWRDARPDWILD